MQIEPDSVVMHSGISSFSDVNMMDYPVAHNRDDIAFSVARQCKTYAESCFPPYEDDPMIVPVY